MPLPAAAPVAPAAATTYTLRAVEQMLGASRGVIGGLVEAGCVVPARGARNELRFSFQDVVLLRTAMQLRAAQIAPRRLLRALKQLRAQLPADAPMSGLRITAVGSEVAVHDAGGAPWAAQTGQFLLDFDVTVEGGAVAFLQRRPTANAVEAATAHEAEPATAADWHSRGEALEAHDPAGAEAAYRQAIELAPSHVHAWVNLGALLCDAGRCAEAVELLATAARAVPDAPLIHFNAGIALEDLKHNAEALRSYERCIALAPQMADAHFNAARLCEKLGDAQGTLRHFSAYRRLQRAAPAPPA